MDGCDSKELPGYKYEASTPAYGGNTPASSGYGGQQNQMEDEKPTTGGSAVEELVEGGMTSGGGGGGGRKKKKKHKSGGGGGEETSNSTKTEEDLGDAVLPMLPEGQDVDSMLFPSTLPPSGGTLVGGQYLLNNSLLDQILTEKKMQILQSPEVIEFLRKQLPKK